MVNKCDKNLVKSKLLMGLEFAYFWIGQEVRFEVVECMLKLESALLLVSC